MECREYVKEYLRRVGRGDAAGLLDSVSVENIEVPNAPLYAEFAGVDYSGFCGTTGREPCDKGPADLILEKLAELTGLRPSYVFYDCKGGGHDVEEELCSLLDKISECIYEADAEEELARLDAALNGYDKAVIFWEGDWSWDVYALIGDDDEAKIEELEKFLDRVDKVKDILAEYADSAVYDKFSDLEAKEPRALKEVLDKIDDAMPPEKVVEIVRDYLDP